MKTRMGIIALAFACRAIGGEAGWCGPVAEVRTEIEKAAGNVRDPEAFDAALGRLRAMREAHPRDLAVEMRYQDLVMEYGPTTIRRAMPHEYETLRTEHPHDVVYQYLHGRSMQGRATRLTIESMDGLLAGTPDFAPAYRTLVEIYGSAAFHNAAKEKENRDRYSKLCPGVAIAARPGPMPTASRLLAQAQQRYDRRERLEEAEGLVDRFVKREEWRGEIASKFDWYSTEDRVRMASEVQSNLFQAWRLLVLIDRKLGKQEEAARMMGQLEAQLPRLKLLKPTAYRTASGIVAELRTGGGAH